MKPVVHQDTWFLRITPPAPDAPANSPPTVRWERRKRPANGPSPPRAGATQVYHRGRGICFGGVYDVELSEEGIDSEFFNHLFAYNIDRNRFFQLSLRRPRTSAKKAIPPSERGRRGRGKANEEELLRNLALIEKGSSLEQENRAEDDIDDADRDESEDGNEAPLVEKTVMWEMPHPRFNAQLAVQDDVLYIYSGTFEKGDQGKLDCDIVMTVNSSRFEKLTCVVHLPEWTFDEMWSIDLGKLDGVKEVFHRELEDWQGSDEEESEDDDEEEDEDSDGSDAEDEVTPSTPATSVTAEEPSDQQDSNATQEETEEAEPSAQDDQLPYPRPFEALRDFFSRTSNEWQNVVLEAMKYERGTQDQSVKEIRKRAFDRAEQKW